MPPIVDTDLFDATQAKLVDHRPQNQSARVTTTDNLLIGLARCGCNGDGCGGAMTNNTSKSGQYKYYACSDRARSGATVCSGRRIPMPRLDDIVLNALETRLLVPERLHELLSGWLDHSQQATAGRRKKLRQLRTRQTTLEGGLERLLDLVVAGQLTASNPIFAKKNADLTEQLAHVKTDILMLERQLEQSERSHARTARPLCHVDAGTAAERGRRPPAVLRPEHPHAGRGREGRDQAGRVDEGAGALSL